jgi:Metallo-beta-lactamase superfamily
VKLTSVGLDPKLLYIFVFGPGFGESIIVRVPTNEWLVVDSLRRQTPSEDRNPALDFLIGHDAHLSAVALTHPHADHARGFIQLLDRRRPLAPVGCLSAFLRRDATWRADQDAAKVLDEATIWAALNRIDHIWRTEPSSRWPLRAGVARKVGQATIEVLHPRTIPRGRPRTGFNRLSSPMLIRWRDCRILLGADLPRAGWNEIKRSWPAADTLADTQALKAAHHASKGAQHPIAIGSPPPTSRPCFITPFNRGRRLPSYADAHGIDQLLQSNVDVGVTVVPAHARGARTPRAKMGASQEAFGDFTVVYEEPSVSTAQGWIAAAFDAAGGHAGLWFGDAAGSVTA